MLTQSELKKCLHYNPDTGIFTWLVSRGRVKTDDIAGGLRRDCYIHIRVFGKKYLAHRLAFLYMEGGFPKNDTDHINQIRNDNRWANLRYATNSENHRNVPRRANNTSGYKGVSFYKQRGKFVAQTTFNGKAKYLGLFPTAELASEAFQAFAKQHYGEFYCKS